MPDTSSKQHLVVSLFSGGGGADIGLTQAGLEVAVSHDYNAHAVATLRANVDHPVVHGDIRAQVDADPACRFLLDPAGLEPGEAFVVVGGPPCQTFSQAGQRAGVADPRGTLWETYAKVVEATRPRFFVMENVKGILTTLADPSNPKSGPLVDAILARFHAMGYTTVHGVLDAVCYGAPQFRERLVILGSRDGEDIFLPEPTHWQRHQDPACRWRTLRDAIADLNNPGPGSTFIKNVEYFRHIPAGGDWRDLPERLKVKMFGAAWRDRDISKCRFARLAWNEPTATLTTDPTSRFAPFTHPTEHRPLSVRECARLQGFPDNWQFRGGLVAQYTQVGNAWAVPLGRAIGQALVATATETALVHTRRKSAAKLPTAFITVAAEQPVKTVKRAKKATQTGTAPAPKPEAAADHAKVLATVVKPTLRVVEPAKESSPKTSSAPKEQLRQPTGGFGAALRDAREEKKLSMTALAAAVGLTKGAVAKVEEGGGRLDTVLVLAEHLGLEVVGQNLPGGDTLGARLAELRQIRGYSHRAVARETGIAAQTIAEVDGGNTRVHAAKVEKYAALLGATLTLAPKGRAAAPHWGSSEKDHWTTPRDFALRLAGAVGGQFDLDAASPGAALSPIPARRHYTMADDGLAQPWRGNTWVNPPYDNTAAWMEKAVGEVENGNARMVVALVKASTGAAYWREWVVDHGGHVVFVTGRLKFGGAKGSATFDSAVVVWGGTKSDHHRIEAAVRAWEKERPGRRRRKEAGTGGLLPMAA